MYPIRNILFATDFSRASEDAFDVACALTRDYKAGLIVAHVRAISPVVYGEFGAVPPSPNDDTEALTALLTAMKPASGGMDVKYFLAEGDPATEIIRMATDHACDLIVLGTHGRTGLGRLLMGSVAEVVVRKAPCPVLTIKRPLTVPAMSIKAECEPATV